MRARMGRTLARRAVNESVPWGGFSELQERRRDQVGRGHTFWVVQISGSFQRCLGTCANRRAGILSNEIEAQPSDNGASVVSVQTVKGEAVVEQSRGLMEHLTSHLEIHLGPLRSNCLCSCQELIERWAYGAVRHSASLAVRPRPGKRIWRSVCQGDSLSEDPSGIAATTRKPAILGWPTSHPTGQPSRKASR
jgi:hypothetical protein